MARPKKLPDNVIRFNKADESRYLPRAVPFKTRARYFYRETPPNEICVIFEYIYHHEPQSWLYAGGVYINGKAEFHMKKLHDDYLAGKIKLLSWRLEREWHSVTPLA